VDAPITGLHEDKTEIHRWCFSLVRLNASLTFSVSNDNLVVNLNLSVFHLISLFFIFNTVIPCNFLIRDTYNVPLWFVFLINFGQNSCFLHLNPCMFIYHLRIMYYNYNAWKNKAWKHGELVVGYIQRLTDLLFLTRFTLLINGEHENTYVTCTFALTCILILMIYTPQIFFVAQS